MVFVGCGDPLRRNVVARADEHILTVDRFAELLVEGDVQLNPTVVEQWAWMWLQYSLFLQGIARGDSFTDTATVMEAMWPEVLTSTVEVYFQRLLSEQVVVDATILDSVYNVGDHRIIDHIMIRADERYSADEKATQRRRAETIRDRLAAGRTWVSEAQTTDDYATRASRGRLGLIARGEVVPEVEEAAFMLEPGELSDVVETRDGYHIVRRPSLEEVREEYAEEIRALLTQRWRRDFTNTLAQRYHLQVANGGPEIIRDVADRPIRTLVLERGRLIGTYDGGELTDVDYVGWLQALPVLELRSMGGAEDEQLKQMAGNAMRWEVLFLEAKSVGTTLSDSVYRVIEEELDGRLARVRIAMRVDSAIMRAGTGERERIAREVLDQYMVGILVAGDRVTLVPPFLARKLRRETDWEFSYGGLDRAILRAERLRAARDTLETRKARSSAR
jgi:hypothetical protein